MKTKAVSDLPLCPALWGIFPHLSVQHHEPVIDRPSLSTREARVAQLRRMADALERSAK